MLKILFLITIVLSCRLSTDKKMNEYSKYSKIKLMRIITDRRIKDSTYYDILDYCFKNNKKLLDFCLLNHNNTRKGLELCLAYQNKNIDLIKFLKFKRGMRIKSFQVENLMNNNSDLKDTIVKFEPKLYKNYMKEVNKTKNIHDIENFHNYCRKGNFEKIKSVLKSGFDINSRNKKPKNTPLITALYFRKYELANFLLKNSADPTLLNDYKKTALYYSYLRNTKEFINIFKSKYKMKLRSREINKFIKLKYRANRFGLFCANEKESIQKYVKIHCLVELHLEEKTYHLKDLLQTIYELEENVFKARDNYCKENEIGNFFEYLSLLKYGKRNKYQYFINRFISELKDLATEDLYEFRRLVLHRASIEKLFNKKKYLIYILCQNKIFTQDDLDYLVHLISYHHDEIDTPMLDFLFKNGAKYYSTWKNIISEELDYEYSPKLLKIQCLYFLKKHISSKDRFSSDLINKNDTKLKKVSKISFFEDFQNIVRKHIDLVKNNYQLLAIFVIIINSSDPLKLYNFLSNYEIKEELWAPESEDEETLQLWPKEA